MVHGRREGRAVGNTLDRRDEQGWERRKVQEQCFRMREGDEGNGEGKVGEDESDELRRVG